MAFTFEELGGKRLSVASIVPFDNGFFSGALRPSGILIMYFLSLFRLNISSMWYLLKLPEAFPSEGSYISVTMRRPASLTLLRPNEENLYFQLGWTLEAIRCQLVWMVFLATAKDKFAHSVRKCLQRRENLIICESVG